MKPQENNTLIQQIIEEFEAMRQRIFELEKLVDEAGLTDGGRERRILELQYEAANKRGPEEIITICAACKKIRGDGGEWTNVEEYFHEHFGTEFSHGICPECAKGRYADLHK